MSFSKHHQTPDGWREAVYSDCERYRYTLRIAWQDGGRRLLYVMLNPSKATELANDPTIERCERRARMLGYGEMEIANLFALRETSPHQLKKARSPEGSENTHFLITAAARADDILLAWGVHGAHLGQADHVLPVLLNAGKPVLHLGQTKDGHPRHPLYIGYGIKPIAWLV